LPHSPSLAKALQLAAQAFSTATATWLLIKSTPKGVVFSFFYPVCKAEQCAGSQSVFTETRSLLVEQALLSIEAKLVQPASPCFQCNHLQVPENLPEWLLFDFLTF